MLIETIKKRANEIANEIIEIRKTIHRNPELSYQEFETQKLIQQKLTEYNISYTTVANTGTLAIIKGNNHNTRCIALRADIDALPIHEENKHDFVSNNNGIMHACGHDVHTSCLLGAAKILNETKSHWEGTVKLLFQPGEEKNPGGATFMIKDGVLENPKPSGIYALHVHPGLPTGQLSFRSGYVMASADELYITLNASGGHAAAPHLTTDLIVIASQIVLGLQQVISRHNNPFNPSVLSITSIQAGNTTNVIPSELKMKGTLRCMDEDWRTKAHQYINKYVTETAQTFGAIATVLIDIGYPTVYNNPQLNNTAVNLANQFLGEDNVSETEMRMGAEDFAYYAKEIPGCFFRLGVRNEEKNIIHGVHTPIFDADENAFKHGIGMMAILGALG